MTEKFNVLDEDLDGIDAADERQPTTRYERNPDGSGTRFDRQEDGTWTETPLGPDETRPRERWGEGRSTSEEQASVPAEVDSLMPSPDSAPSIDESDFVDDSAAAAEPTDLPEPDLPPAPSPDSTLPPIDEPEVVDGSAVRAEPNELPEPDVPPAPSPDSTLPPIDEPEVVDGSAVRAEPNELPEPDLPPAPSPDSTLPPIDEPERAASGATRPRSPAAAPPDEPERPVDTEAFAGRERFMEGARRHFYAKRDGGFGMTTPFEEHFDAAGPYLRELADSLNEIEDSFGRGWDAESIDRLEELRGAGFTPEGAIDQLRHELGGGDVFRHDDTGPTS